jgi:hypothetical protein
MMKYSGQREITPKQRQKWRRQYEAKRLELVAILQQADVLLQGSAVLQRYQRKTKSGIKQCGPYHLWTRKERGKTVTVSLTKEQYEDVGQAIATRRKVDKLLKEMQQLSQQILLDR